MNKIRLIYIFIMFCYINSNAQTVIDIDGNLYDTVKIGTQTWLKQNLRVEHFNNGDLIPTTIPWNQDIYNNRFYKLIYQWSINGDNTNDSVYGKLYTWNVVCDNRKVCPLNYRVSDDIDWQILINYLGGDTVAGRKLKSDDPNWIGNLGSDNSSNFTALPAGFKDYTWCRYFNYAAVFWSATEMDDQFAWHYALNATDKVEYNSTIKTFGLSVRCIKDVIDNSIILSNDENILVYPNPATNMIFIKNSYTNTTITLYNFSGIKIKHFDYFTNKIDVSDCKNGIYILELKTNNKIIERKINIYK